MTKLKAVAIDDEPLALQLVTGYIKKTPFLEFAGAYENPLDALKELSMDMVDLIFLDIHMPDITGTEFARSISRGPGIIFTTAYEKYALEGYKLEAVDYLLKPFSYEDFLRASQKALKMHELERKAAGHIETTGEYLFVKSEYKIRRIKFSNIMYIEGLKDYVKIYVENETRPVFSLNSLKHLDEKLPGSDFMRVHRSYIVNLDKIETIERGRILFGDKAITVGDQYKEKFQVYLDKNFL
jgi:two-component system, LytTR family, response regulator LytT